MKSCILPSVNYWNIWQKSELFIRKFLMQEVPCSKLAVLFPMDLLVRFENYLSFHGR